MQGLHSGAESEEELGREGSGPMVLGSEISDELADTDESDEIVGISKSGSNVETVGMLFNLGGAPRCDGGRRFGAVRGDEDSSKHSRVVWYVAPVLVV
jgi:hypothetical protein